MISLCTITTFSGFTVEDVPEDAIAYSPNGLAEHPPKMTRLSGAIVRNSSNKDYSTEWDEVAEIIYNTDEGYVSVGKMSYGYVKKIFTGYDYTEVYASGGYNHCAGIKNDKYPDKTQWTNYVSGGFNAYIELQHQPNYTTYYYGEVVVV